MKDAISEIETAMASAISVADLLAKTRKHIESEHKHIPADPLYPTLFSDQMQCFTTFLPRNDPAGSLEALVIPSGDGKQPFKSGIFEGMYISVVIFLNSF